MIFNRLVVVAICLALGRILGIEQSAAALTTVVMPELAPVAQAPDRPTLSPTRTARHVGAEAMGFAIEEADNAPTRGGSADPILFGLALGLGLWSLRSAFKSDTTVTSGTCAGPRWRTARGAGAEDGGCYPLRPMFRRTRAELAAGLANRAPAPSNMPGDTGQAVTTCVDVIELDADGTPVQTQRICAPRNRPSNIDNVEKAAMVLGGLGLVLAGVGLYTRARRIRQARRPC